MLMNVMCGIGKTMANHLLEEHPTHAEHKTLFFYLHSFQLRTNSMYIPTTSDWLLFSLKTFRLISEGIRRRRRYPDIMIETCNDSNNVVSEKNTKNMMDYEKSNTLKLPLLANLMEKQLKEDTKKASGWLGQMAW